MRTVIKSFIFCFTFDMALAPLQIGIYGASELETVHRCFLGVLRYTEEIGGFLVRDFRKPMPYHDSERLILPPPLSHATSQTGLELEAR